MPVTTAPVFKAGTPAALFEGDYMPAPSRQRPYDVTPDGRFVMVKLTRASDDGAPDIIVVENPGSRS